ncbi:multiple sugar transport system permease protein [Pullulanibacillus pueri]|uniref:Sugar ABC transporter permease n=1 Tax=Pullulanibacillus pueri TaxID=1437324 RepID=A0A8J2ZTX6_9BACL|nr:carbohydrate ABC transporter permease [Pullulanibacillus pueri]MBM7681820.1 multiple sugar transport system permease protein [Pullulanibacillus pueri]GGH76216.1 sugar ABC transporter permease [Pullulanibacillus pueri]
MTQKIMPQTTLGRDAQPKSKVKTSHVFIYIFLVLLAIICIVPFYIMIIYGTHTNSEIASKFIFLPGSALVENYHSMMENVNIWRGFMNSLIISCCSTALTLYFGALNAYGFAKFKFKGNKVLFWFVLATMMVPQQLGLVGTFRIMYLLHLLDTYAALILPAAANAFAVFFVKQFIDGTIPDEIMESARVDGAGEFKTFNRIILPMLVPALAALGIFSFIGSWNNFMGPLVLLFSNDKYPLPLLVQLLQGYYGTNYGVQYLGVALSVLPIIIAFAIFSKRIIGSVAIGAVKG